jgi:hypothetical protein
MLAKSEMPPTELVDLADEDEDGDGEPDGALAKHACPTLHVIS